MQKSDGLSIFSAKKTGAANSVNDRSVSILEQHLFTSSFLELPDFCLAQYGAELNYCAFPSAYLIHCIAALMQPRLTSHIERLWLA